MKSSGLPITSCSPSQREYSLFGRCYQVSGPLTVDAVEGERPLLANNACQMYHRLCSLHCCGQGRRFRNISVDYLDACSLDDVRS